MAAAAAGEIVVFVGRPDALDADPRLGDTRIVVLHCAILLNDAVPVLLQRPLVKRRLNHKFHVGVQKERVVAPHGRTVQRMRAIVAEILKRLDVDFARLSRCRHKRPNDIRRIVGRARIANAIGVYDGEDRAKKPLDNLGLVLDNHVETEFPLCCCCRGYERKCRCRRCNRNRPRGNCRHCRLFCLKRRTGLLNHKNGWCRRR